MRIAKQSITALRRRALLARQPLSNGRVRIIPRVASANLTDARWSAADDRRYRAALGIHNPLPVYVDR